MSGRPGQRLGRQRRRAERARKKAELRLPPLYNRLPFVEVFDEEAFERVHEAAMRILEEFGIQYRCPRAREHWRQAGARIAGEMVHADRSLVAELVARAPAEFELASRNPRRRVRIGGRSTLFAPMQGAPYVRDLDGVRRGSTLEDIHRFNRLTQMAPCYHIAPGFVAEAMDLPVPHRHLEWVKSSLVHTDLPFFGAPNEPVRARDSIEMTRIVHGDEFLRDNAVTICHINCNSPRLFDDVLLECARIHADADQAVLVSPFVLAQANAPADIAGTLAQLSAEALSGIAYLQLYRPGTKCIMGQFTVSTSLRSGAPMAGVPEIALINFGVGQMARRYRLPWRTTTSQASAKVFDAQSGYESAPGFMTGILAGANLMLHAGGWDEAGLVNCYAKFVVDAEQCALYHRLGCGVSLERLDDALEAVGRIAPTGHYLDDPFTLDVFEEGFTMPDLLDFTSHPQWEAAGAQDTATRARARALKMLSEYVEPELEVSVRDELDAFVARRRSEISPSIA